MHNERKRDGERERELARERDREKRQGRGRGTEKEDLEHLSVFFSFEWKKGSWFCVSSLDSEFIFLLFIRLVQKKEAGAEMASATPAVASETTPTTTTETPPPPVAGNNIFLFLLLLLLPAAPFFDRMHTMSLFAFVIFAARPGSCAGSGVFVVAGKRRF